MQSADYVPGVSGWEMHKDGRLEVSGTVRVDTNQPAADSSKPFIVFDGVVYISEAELKRATVASAKLTEDWSVRMSLSENGQQVVSGVGLGLDSQILVSADKFAINGRGADEILDDIAKALSETSLSKELCRKIDPLPEVIRSVIREELRPGGLLHRR